MNPKKPKTFIKPTAESLGASETLVDDVVSFFWNAVRKELSSMESPSVSVANIGTFKVRYGRIEQLQKKYTTTLEKMSMDKMTFDKHTVQNIAKEKLDKLAKLKELMEEEYKRKQEVKQKREEYVQNKSVEEQGSDT